MRSHNTVGYCPVFHAYSTRGCAPYRGFWNVQVGDEKFLFFLVYDLNKADLVSSSLQLQSSYTCLPFWCQLSFNMILLCGF